MFKKVALIVIFTLVTIILMSGTVYAGVWGKITGWFSTTVIAYILTGIIAMGAVGGTIMFSRIVTTLKELGEFLTTLGLALSDKKITREELKDILSQGKDVVNIWRKTPDKYKVS